MKRAVIVHCWSGYPEYAWYPWAKAELKKRGYRVSVPQMPDPDTPKLDKWLPRLERAIGEPDKQLLLIGHSIGTVTIMRYLESLPSDHQAGKVILVAAFTDQIGYQELENFFDTRLNYTAIKAKSAGGFVVIQSDDDPYVSEQYGKRLVAELGAKLIVKHRAGHMSGEDNCLELPEAIAAVDKAEA
jgi:uncharacterized protein